MRFLPEGRDESGGSRSPDLDSGPGRGPRARGRSPRVISKVIQPLGGGGGELWKVKEMLTHLYEQGKGEVRVGGAPLSRKC